MRDNEKLLTLPVTGSYLLDQSVWHQAVLVSDGHRLSLIESRSDLIPLYGKGKPHLPYTCIRHVEY